MRLDGKVCVVTGGGRGIGLSIVREMAAQGAARVYACDVSPDGVDELAKEFPAVAAAQLDVRRPEEIQAFVNRVLEQEGRIDVLVNNAGVTRDNLIHKMPDEDWDFVVSINLKGVFNMTREIGPKMMEQGSGAIVNLASVVALDGNVGQSNYAATKGGVVSMTKSWAKEFARKGAKVRCNAVAPGFIRTPMTEKVPQKVLDPIVEKTVLKRMGEPEDVAKAVVFLASEDAGFITSQVLRVDGGLVL